MYKPRRNNDIQIRQLNWTIAVNCERKKSIVDIRFTYLYHEHLSFEFSEIRFVLFDFVFQLLNFAWVVFIKVHLIWWIKMHSKFPLINSKQINSYFRKSRFTEYIFFTVTAQFLSAMNLFQFCNTIQLHALIYHNIEVQNEKVLYFN